METVFNHNITPDEWRKVRGMRKEDYLHFVDAETATADIATLYYLRGDNKRAATYLNKLQPDTRNDLLRVLSHP